MDNNDKILLLYDLPNLVCNMRNLECPYELSDKYHLGKYIVITMRIKFRATH